MCRGWKKLQEPKGQFETHRQGTFELAFVFVECSKRLDRVLRAKWWLQPLVFRNRTQSVSLLRARIDEVSVELGLRYKGVMAEVIERMDPQADLRIELAKTWRRVFEVAIAMHHREFSARLWHAFVPAQKQVNAHALKPKFMLRQFVDEMSPSKDQGILIATAYGPMLNPRPPASEITKCLACAYNLLHAEVKRYSDELDVLTDNEFSAKTISSITAPYVEYEDWLFNYSK